MLYFSDSLFREKKNTTIQRSDIFCENLISRLEDFLIFLTQYRGQKIKDKKSRNQICTNINCLNPFTSTRYPNRVKKIQLAFCNPYGGVKTSPK